MNDMFDSNADMCTTWKDAMAMCIHALMIQQCNPIFWVAHLGLKVLKIDHYYQKNNDYRPYLIPHLHVGPSNLVPSPFAFDPRKNGKQEDPVTLKPRLENNHFLATEVGKDSFLRPGSTNSVDSHLWRGDFCVFPWFSGPYIGPKPFWPTLFVRQSTNSRNHRQPKLRHKKLAGRWPLCKRYWVTGGRWDMSLYGE